MYCFSFQILQKLNAEPVWILQAYMGLLLVLLIPYSLLRHLKYLAPFSMLANVITFFGLLVILQHCFRNLQSIEDLPAFNTWGGLALYFGTAIYAFEGIGVVCEILKFIYENILQIFLVKSIFKYILFMYSGFVRVKNDSQ